MSFNNQSTIKTKRVETLPGNLVMTTHDMISITFPPPHPRQYWSPCDRKMTLLFSIVLGGEGGRKNWVISLWNVCFALKLLLEVFLYNLFHIVAFSSDSCALQKYTIELIIFKRICSIPGTEEVTVTPLQARLFFPFNTKSGFLKLPWWSLSVLEQD